MTQIELIIWNLEEIRRRSMQVWTSIPSEFEEWRPDADALSCIEMVRHILESEHYYHQAILNRGSVANFDSPFEARAYHSIADEIEFGETYHQGFIELIRSINPEELDTIQIDRSDVGYIRTLGDFLLRIGYHEAVHTGQLLQYLRMIPVERPDIWD